MQVPARTLSHPGGGWAASLLAIGCGISIWGSVARADLVILSNRSPTSVKFSAAGTATKGHAYELASGDLIPLTCPTGGKLRIAFMSAGARRDYTLDGNSIYFFHRPQEGNRLDIEQIAIIEPSRKAQPTTQTTEKQSAKSAEPEPAMRPALTKVTVKILVDDDEKAVRSLWEQRLRKRIADASKILEKYAGITLEVVACETWETTDTIQDFDGQLREFEHTVNAAPADLAIGFASQYSVVTGRTHLGGTRGPFAKHIMLREWSRHASEPERLELLVHELGHRFGATHSPEPMSVMRAVLADRKSVARGFLIVFDPVNALAMNLVAEEIRDHDIQHFYQVSPRTRDTLVAIYLTLGKAFPEDPAASIYLALLGESPPATSRPAQSRIASLADAARLVRDAVVDAADRNRRLPRIAPADAGQVRLAGDALTERYVRAAALAALELPEVHRYRAFTLGLAVAIVDTDSFMSNSLTRDLIGRVENASERARRLDVIGAPTLLERNDLARHFFFSAAIATLSSSAISESAGLLKEMQDSQGKSGFSFTDLAADLAGIALADYIRGSDAHLREMADSFTIAEFMPSLQDLREGLSFAAFHEAYGTSSDPRFLKEVNQIRERVKQLPVYAKAAAADGARKQGGRR